MRQPRGILFDYGNTILIEDNFDLLAGTRRIVEHAQGEVRLSPEEIQEEYDRLNNEINAVRNSTHYEFPNRYLQHTLYEYLGIRIALSPEEMERQFWRAAQRFKPSEYVYEMLEWLRSRHVRCGIISNCSFSAEVMREELVRLNLDHYFDFFISSADYGFRKPHPRIFQIALRKLAIQAEDAWFAGDTLDFDIKGALNSGLLPIWYNRKNQENLLKHHCLEIKNWKEMVEILEPLWSDQD